MLLRDRFIGDDGHPRIAQQFFDMGIGRADKAASDQNIIGTIAERNGNARRGRAGI